MVKTIGNPLSWVAQGVTGAAGHITHSVERIGGEEDLNFAVNRLTDKDLRAALRAGFDDFAAARADVIFICLLYPVIGVALAGLGLNTHLLPLLFPAAAGFALVGPLAAIGLYEISRRRELGEPVNWGSAFGVLSSPNFGALLVLGLYLLAIFLTWIAAAWAVYQVTLGPEPPESARAFLMETLTTDAGWVMVILGTGVGFLFALAVLVMSVVSFPLLLDHNVGVPKAVITSYEVFRQNPRVILNWGAIVVVGLVLGSIPLFVGLVVVLPVLGHATWHLYRRAVRIEPA